MGLARTIARRSLLGHPGRTLFSVLGVAVGIATVVSVFVLDHVTVLARTRHLAPDWGADLEVRPSTQLGDPRAELLALKGVAGVAAFFQNHVVFRPMDAGPGEDREDGDTRVHLVALEAGSGRSLGAYHVERGEDLDAGSAADGCLVGRALAEQFDLEVGDRVALSQTRRAGRRACVEGEVQTLDEATAEPRPQAFRVAGILAYEGIGRRANGEVVVVDYDAGRRLLRDVFVETQFWVKRDDAVDLEALESNLSGTFSFDRNETRAVGQMADERAFRNGVRLAGLFALLLGLFVIFHTLSMSLVERVREVGSLHALGAARSQIARVFFVEAVFIAFFAGVLGLAGGLLLAAGMLREGITTLGVRNGPVRPFDVPWDTVLTLVLLGMGIALLGSIYPILRARDTDVVAAVRGDEPGRRSASHGFHLFSTLLLVAVVPAAFFAVVPIVGAAESTLVWTVLLGLVVLGLMIGLPLMVPALFGSVASRLVRPFERAFPLAGKLAARSIEQSPNRIGASVAAIALVTAAFVGLRGMTNSLAGEIEVWGAVAVRDKVWVADLPDVDLDALRDALHEQPEVLAVESGDARKVLSFLLFGQRTDELAGHGPLADDPTLARALKEEQTILVSDRLARQRNLSPGDSVLIQTSGHGVQEFRVLAITDAYGYFPHPDERAYGIVDERHLKRFFCVDVDTTTRVSVCMDGEDLGLVAAVLRERFPAARGLRFTRGPGVLRYLLEDIRRDFVIFDIILFLTAVLAGLGVLNGQLLTALERRKELGILRALGMTRAQVAGAVLLESAILGLCGGVLGVIVGSGLTPVLVSSLRILSGLALPLRTAGAFVGFSVAGALVLALLAGLYPIWRMNRLDAVRAVSTG